MKTTLIAVVGIFAATACAGPVPVITRVEPQGLPEGTRVSPVDIGDDGTIVVAVNSTTALLQEDGAITQFPLPPGYTTCTPARRANDGTIVGTCSGQPVNPALISPFAVFWDASGAVHEIDTENLTNTSAIDINDNGIVVGYATQGTARTPWIYNLNTQAFTVLSVPPGAIDTVARSINDSGDIVGAASFVELPTTRAVLWTRETLALRSLPAPANRGTIAYGINNKGVIVGVQRDASLPPNEPSLGALVWQSAAAVPQALPLPVGPIGQIDSSGVARAINDEGRVIGHYGSGSFDYSLPRGVLWTSDRRAVALDHFLIPVAINSSGRVLAARENPGGPTFGASLIDW